MSSTYAHSARIQACEKKARTIWRSTTSTHTHTILHACTISAIDCLCHSSVRTAGLKHDPIRAVALSPLASRAARSQYGPKKFSIYVSVYLTLRGIKGQANSFHPAWKSSVLTSRQSGYFCQFLLQHTSRKYIYCVDYEFKCCKFGLGPQTVLVFKFGPRTAKR